MPIATALLPEFDHEMAGVRRVLERIPDDRMDFRPHPRSFSLHQLANHVATVPCWATATMATTELDFATPAARTLVPAPSDTVAGMLRAFDLGVGEARKALAGASDEDFAVVWSGKNAGAVVFAQPRIAVLRSFVMNHVIHHRAQLTVYLRLLDVPVPALYGPSADEASV